MLTVIFNGVGKPTLWKNDKQVGWVDHVDLSEENGRLCIRYLGVTRAATHDAGLSVSELDRIAFAVEKDR
jgi:hypothetical protein